MFHGKLSGYTEVSMTRVIAVANQKGGVGKTTTAHALIAGLTLNGFKTLAVDIDPQSNLTFTLNPETTTPTIYDLMTNEAEVEEAIQHTDQGDIIPGSLDLAGADMEFSKTGREYILAEIIKPLRALYDYIIIDTPPTLGILTVNALTTADDLVVPMWTDAFSVQGITHLHDTIVSVKKHCNSRLNVAGILITHHNGRTTLARDMRQEDIEERAKLLKTCVFKTAIRESVAIKEAQVQQRNLYTQKSNNAVADYLTFVAEYIKGGK